MCNKKTAYSPIRSIGKMPYEFLYHAFRQYMWFCRVDIQIQDFKSRNEREHWARIFSSACKDLMICDVEMLYYFLIMRPDLNYNDNRT